ncbi:hydrogenase maturation nickel metallochaperone HypA [Candidatus Woesearchaeota archaeon]|nr:hydrogenase maturation nickel metallochaperone HypA [Candidatus Woesearchaeota archaeon]MBS3150171.1 hydrogenase maturation nickel metallochaperone HypA [Candidatus Woesearchaeota archaeon]
MHDLKIIDKILKEASKKGNINILKLEVGELSDVSPLELKEHLEEHVTYKIDVNLKKSKVKCKCSYIGPAEILLKDHGICLFRCPNCKNKPEVIEGGEIKIIGVK